MSTLRIRPSTSRVKPALIWELIIFSAVAIFVMLVEWLTDFDSLVIRWAYDNKNSGFGEFVVYGFIIALLSAMYAIRQTIRSRKLINKQLETEKHLQSSQQQLEMILSNSATILYTAPPDGNSGTTYISTNVKNILGYEPDDFKQPGFWYKIINPEDASRVFNSFDEFYSVGSFENEFRVRHKNGSWCWIYNKMILVLDEKGDHKEMVGTWLDITERKHAQQAIRKSEQRFQLAAKATKDVIYDWDMQKNEAWANDQHFLAFGYPKQESNIVTAEWWKSKLHPEDRDRIVDSIREATREKRDTWTSEYHFLRADGTYAYILDRCIITYLENGLPARCIGTMTDLSELKNTEEELILAKEKAEESAKAKSDFLANMSHEIRTPLNGIIGMTDMTLETDLTAEQKYYLNIVKSSSETLLGLINDILDFSKIDAGRLEFSATSFSLRDEFPKALQALGLQAAEKDLEFIYRIDQKVPDKLIGDALRLQQIIVNLAGNAIKFTEKGEVAIKVKVQEVSKDEAVLQFTVSDTGIGIPEDKLSMIFDKFTQADASTSRKYGGTGLGLAITKRLVELMGGTVWAESKVLYGSSFHFTAKFKIDTTKELSRCISTSNLENKRVLIVEDNKSTSEYLTEMLRHFKMKTVAVSNGKDALLELTRAVRLKQHYDLVILDITLPGQINGFDVAQTIRQDDLFKESEVIVVTMSQKASDRQKFAQMGITEFFSKPFNQSDLLESMQNILSGKKILFEDELRFAHAKPGTSSAITANETLKILLAEDNKVNQEVAISILTKQGYDVRIANNGEEAVKAVQKELFDLVLMDVQMPAMNGYEATQKIRQMQEPGLPHIPIIGLTANALSGDRQKCLDAGMDDYLSKPINMKTLLATIAKLHKNGSAFPNENCKAPDHVNFKVGFEELLNKLGGSKKVIASCLNLFNEEIPPLLIKLDFAFQRMNTEEVKWICHGLRSSLLTMEMYAATKLAARIETLAGQTGFEEIKELLPMLKNEIREACEFIQKNL